MLSPTDQIFFSATFRYSVDIFYSNWSGSWSNWESSIEKRENTSRGTSISIIMQNQIHRDGFMSWGSDRARTLPQTRMNLSHEIGLLFLASPPSTYARPDYLIRRPDSAMRSLSSVIQSVLMVKTNSFIDHAQQKEDETYSSCVPLSKLRFKRIKSGRESSCIIFFGDFMASN